MSDTRENIHGCADINGWVPIASQHQRVDIYRREPFSVMIEFSRDGMVVSAQVFGDAPESRQKLPPRQLEAVGKFDDNKRQKIRWWFARYCQPGR